MLKRCCFVCLIVLVSAIRPISAQTPDIEFFEARIRPVLVQKCYSCHNSKMPAPKGSLVLDSKEGLLKGGTSGPALVPGKPAESRLLKALSYSDPLAQMPPSGKLPDAVLADFEQWIARGAADPRANVSALASAEPQYKGMSLEEGRKWWAFQPVAAVPAPKTARADGWPKTKIDNFVLAKLQEKKLAPSPQADRRTFVTRAYVDLVGYKPTYEEIEAFLNDRSPNAYENLIDRLLASPHYGERWGRHWMDVARYGEDNPTGGDQSGVSFRLALSRLDHRSHQSGRAVRPVRQAPTRRRPDARHAACRLASARISGRRARLSQGPASLGAGDRRLSHGRLGRTHRCHHARPARP